MSGPSRLFVQAVPACCFRLDRTDLRAPDSSCFHSDIADVAANHHRDMFKSKIYQLLEVGSLSEKQVVRSIFVEYKCRPCTESTPNSLSSCPRHCCNDSKSALIGMRDSLLSCQAGLLNDP